MLVSTKTVGGHVDTILSQGPNGRRRRRLHSDEFKADAVAAVAQPGVSMAAVAMSRGINANLLRRWVRDAESKPLKAKAEAVKATVGGAPAPSAFMAVQLPALAASTGEIRLELRRGAMTVVVTWPAASAAECAVWLRELLR
jgi:transposase